MTDQDRESEPRDQKDDSQDAVEGAERADAPGTPKGQQTTGQAPDDDPDREGEERFDAG